MGDDQITREEMPAPVAPPPDEQLVEIAANGVAQIATRGSADTWPEAAAAAIRASSEGLEG